MIASKPIPVERALTTAFVARFLSHTAADGDCIVWTGPRRKKGYGYISLHSSNYAAHRIAWVISRGSDIPPGLVVCHRCDNPPCVNPDHLFIGTVADNARDMAAKGRATGGPKPRQVCKRGLHQYTPDNVVVFNGQRRCLACKREAVNAYGRARRRRERALREAS